MDGHGDTSFVYDAAWLNDPHARPVSCSLPKREEPFDRRTSRPFFASLLPDETVCEVVARVLGVSERNDFSLLKALSGDSCRADQSAGCADHWRGSTAHTEQPTTRILKPTQPSLQPRQRTKPLSCI